MKIELAVQCDGFKCDKISLDYMADGWIVLEPGTGITKYSGRDKHGTAQSERFIQTISASRHFCGWLCLQKEQKK